MYKSYCLQTNIQKKSLEILHLKIPVCKSISEKICLINHMFKSVVWTCIPKLFSRNLYTWRYLHEPPFLELLVGEAISKYTCWNLNISKLLLCSSMPRILCKIHLYKHQCENLLQKTRSHITCLILQMWRYSSGYPHPESLFEPPSLYVLVCYSTSKTTCLGFHISEDLREIHV